MPAPVVAAAGAKTLLSKLAPWLIGAFFAPGVADDILGIFDGGSARFERESGEKIATHQYLANALLVGDEQRSRSTARRDRQEERTHARIDAAGARESRENLIAMQTALAQLSRSDDFTNAMMAMALQGTEQIGMPLRMPPVRPETGDLYTDFGLF